MSWSVRFVFAVFIVLASVSVYISNNLLVERFTQSTQQKAQLRLALYTGNLMSELRRNAPVPLLLAKDAEMVAALSSNDFQRSSQRLLSFVDEIGAANLILLDQGGRIVAATDRNLLGGNRNDSAAFVEARRSNKTVFTLDEKAPNIFEFTYSRQIIANNEPLGVLVVEVDLRKFQQSWAGISEAVIITESDGRIILSTEKNWLGTQEQEAMARRSVESAIMRAFRATRDWTALPLEDSIAERAVLREEQRIPFQGWKMITYTAYGDVRQRVNAILSLQIMGFAIFLALVFYLLSRRTQIRALFFQEESEKLRQLNTLLQREMSERKKIEQNLQVAEQTIEQSSKLAALGEMSAAVSHELNQPLAAMKTYLAGAKLLLQRERTEESLSSFQRIDDLIDRMSGITRQLKSYARKGGDDFAPFDIRDAISDALSIMTPQLETRRVALTVTMPDEPVIVMGDQLRFEQVVVNLLLNALDATSSIVTPEIKILLIKGENAVLTVRDNGDGIKDLDALFEPFYTTKKPGDGVGLGLAISSGIVKDLSGRLTARNASHKGAVFEVMLPIWNDTEN